MGTRWDLPRQWLGALQQKQNERAFLEGRKMELQSKEFTPENKLQILFPVGMKSLLVLDQGHQR